MDALVLPEERQELISLLDQQTLDLGPVGPMELWNCLPRDLAGMTRVTGIRKVDIANIARILSSSASQRNDGSWPVIDFIENTIQIDPSSATSVKLREFYDRMLARAGSVSAGISLEGLVNRVAKFANPELWVARMSESMRTICRIVTPNMMGTGFLIGPNLVMTNYHVVASAITNPDEQEQIKLEFDYRKDSQGRPISATKRKTYTLDTSKPIIGSPIHEYDYALLTLKEQAGEDVIADTGAKRGWLKPKEHKFEKDQYVLILQHPKGDHLGLAVDRVTKSFEKRVQYKTNTEAGSSGSPCFNEQWDLVAIHHAGDDSANPTWNQGIPFSAILQLPAFQAKLHPAADTPAKAEASSTAVALGSDTKLNAAPNTDSKSSTTPAAETTASDGETKKDPTKITPSA